MRLLSLCLLAACLHGAIVDRAAVTVGNKVITESEVYRRIRLTAFQNGVTADLSPASLRDATRHLIDLKLVEREMDVGHYERTGSIIVDALMINFAKDHYRGSAEALGLALASVGLTVDDLREEFLEQADLLSFLTLRFRPAVDVTPQEIEKYYSEHFDAATTPLSDVRVNIAEKLTNQHSDEEMEAWLKDQREHTRIVYLVKELQ